jgi:malonyl-CoA/methylmalonyl-CoA synthetase
MFLHGPDVASYSYRDLEVLSSQLAHRLTQQGAVRGDRILVQVQKTPLAIFLYLACLRAGFVFLPLNPAYRADELHYVVNDARPTVIVCDPQSPLCDPDFADEDGPAVLTLDSKGEGSLSLGLEDLPKEFVDAQVDGDDLAAILYTSGTTGRPKGAMLSHENLGSNALALHETWAFRNGDILLHALPIFHTHGLFVAINTTLLSGGKMLFLSQFDVDEVIRLLPNTTVMMGVPTFYTRLLDSPSFDARSCETIRLFVSGSAPLSPETFDRFYQRTGHKILERYGMTETSMIASNPLQGDRKAGSVGFPLPGVKVRISGEGGKTMPNDEVGSIEVKGPNVFKGYWDQPEKTAAEFTADGYFVTGDLGLFDAQGYLHIVGRSKDLIISGGLNVYPKEVESVIEWAPGVADVAVIGVPHPDFGEGVVAVVVRDDDKSQEATDRVLMAHAKRHLASFKVPKAIFFVEALPRNSMGKVEKKQLRQDFAEIFSTPLRDSG